MKKLLSTTLILLVLASTLFTVVEPTPVFAATNAVPTCTLLSWSIGPCFNEIGAWFGNLMLTLASFLVSAAGLLLNTSMRLTLNISDIYDSTPAIENTWLIIRNLSSIFIIFTLLYTSVLTILDVGKTNVKDLVVKIIIAGLLINFSLFFTKAAIDASNLISMQFYRALAPEYVTSLDGGLSDVFMSSLKIQNIYHPDKSALAAGAKSEGEIFVAIMIGTYGGTILMLFAAISFFAAAIAFAIRTAVLIFLLAFSPVYFVGMIFPEIQKDVSDRWLSTLKSQLIFMPVYLLLMYVAMSFITDPGFMSFIQSNKPTGGGAATFIYNQVGIIIQYVIAIVFINVPLIAAVKMGAMGTKFAEGMVKGLTDRIYAQPKALGGMIKGTAGFTAQHTVGRAAKRLQGTVASSAFMSRNPFIGQITKNTLKKVSGAEMLGSKGGFDAREKDYVKAQQEFIENAKITDKDKNKFITAGLSNWDTRKKELKKLIDTNETVTNNETMSVASRQVAMKKLAQLNAELGAMNKAEKDNNKLKYLGDKAEEGRKEDTAAAVEKQSGIFRMTNAARKEAASAYRKKKNESADKKLLKMLKDYSKDSEGDGEKPKGDSKPEGGDKSGGESKPKSK